MTVNNCAKASLFLLLMAVSPLSHAFKISTHVWVGQQVVNDLEDDGKLAIRLNGKTVLLDVRADVRSAILGNKADFLMGNIGPDAVPDVLVGQMIVHPGLETGWKTDRWLSYLLGTAESSPTAKAFAYGYLGHAAADVFAHTYVNQYSGDIFLLLDGEKLVEQRHVALESFIEKYTPPLKNYQGTALGTAGQQLVMSDRYANFVRDALIYNDDVASQYRIKSSAPHLAAIQTYRKKINDLAEDPFWHDVDKAIVRTILNFKGLGFSDAEIGDIANTAQKVVDAVNQDAPDKIQELDDALFSALIKLDGKAFEKLKSTRQKIESAEQQYLDTRHELEDKILEIESNFRHHTCPPAWLDPIGHTLCEKANDLLDRALGDALRVRQELESRLLAQKRDLIESVSDVRDEAIRIATAMRAIQKALVDLKQIPLADASPVQAMLRNWRSDVDLAMAEYVKATSQMMINTMVRDPDAFKPVTTWYQCYNKRMLGVPSPLAGCTIKDSAEEARKGLRNIILIIDEYASLDSLTQLDSKKNKIVELLDTKIPALKVELRNGVIDKLTTFLPQPVQDIITVINENVDGNVLNAYYKKPETEVVKGLLHIADIDARVLAEMHVVDGKYFDPEKYAVVRNAIVLAKLALLDESGLKQLAAAAGLPAGSSGQGLFDGIDNVVAVAFESIDADHQWMTEPPPIPNSNDLYWPLRSAAANAYWFDSETGFIPWKPAVRNSLFRSLFTGPLSPGIDAPELIGKTEVELPRYPYNPGALCPFPGYLEPAPQSCTASGGRKADAGSDQIAGKGATVVLSGIGFVDGSGDAPGTTYQWIQTAGPAVAVSNANMATASFVAPSVSTTAVLTFQLVATVSGVATVASTNVTVINSFPPTVDAGVAQTVNEGIAVTLGSVASDPDGSIVSRRWTQTAGIPVTLSDATSASVGFVSPRASADTDLAFRVTVSDDAGLAGTAYTTVRVHRNLAPTTRLSSLITVKENSPVTIAGAGAVTDSDGFIASYQWKQVEGPPVTLVNDSGPNLGFATPLIAQNTLLRFLLTGTDNQGATASTPISVLVRDNVLPKAIVGAAKTVDEGDAVALTGGGADADGWIVSYKWEKVSGPAVSMTTSTAPTLNFIAPLVSASAVLTFRLTVTDDVGEKASATIKVTVRDTTPPTPPPPVSPCPANANAKVACPTQPPPALP